MIPSVFISSTISDLVDIRYRIRSYLDSIGFHPIMSEHGEVPYLPKYNAKDSCYDAVSRCNILILLIGRRFGSTEEDGKSVVQREHEAAIKGNIPVFALVDRDVMVAKAIYEKLDHADSAALDGTDNPSALYNFIDQVTSQNKNNGLVVFDNVEDAISKLRKQMAGYLGDLLSDQTGPLASRMQDMYADIKAIRTKFDEQDTSEQSTDPALTVPLRTLSKLYRKLVENRFSDIRDIVSTLDAIVDTDPYPLLLEYNLWNDFLSALGVNCEIIDASTHDYNKLLNRLFHSGQLMRSSSVFYNHNNETSSNIIVVSSEPAVYQEPGAVAALDRCLIDLQKGLI